jgi:uncharacterized protein YxjI
MKTSDIEFA